MKIWAQLVIEVARKWWKKKNTLVGWICVLNDRNIRLLARSLLLFEWEITSFSKTMLLQRKSFPTMFYTINSSPLLVTKSVFKLIFVLSNYYQTCTFPLTIASFLRTMVFFPLVLGKWSITVWTALRERGGKEQGEMIEGEQLGNCWRYWNSICILCGTSLSDFSDFERMSFPNLAWLPCSHLSQQKISHPTPSTPSRHPMLMSSWGMFL